MKRIKGRSKAWVNQVEPYLRKVADRVLWRIEPLGYTEEDFIQEAFFIYKKCLARYGTVLAPNGKLSPLFRVSINNFVTDLSHDSTKGNSFLDNGRDVSDLFGEELFDKTDNGYLNILIREAPKEVLEVVNLFFNTPAELLDEVRGFLGAKHSKGFKSNKFLCKMLGYNRAKVNLVELTKNYFSNANDGEEYYIERGGE